MTVAQVIFDPCEDDVLRFVYVYVECFLNALLYGLALYRGYRLQKVFHVCSRGTDKPICYSAREQEKSAVDCCMR